MENLKMVLLLAYRTLHSCWFSTLTELASQTIQKSCAKPLV